jgi:N-acetylmuramoyl-L-alanine amidase
MLVLSLASCIALAIWGCAHKPYSATNKAYRKQARRFAHSLQAQPGIESNDSIRAPQSFVGTTNFSMRKPNFVIIHHTEQQSCEQTLQTFTIPRTEVSAHYVICRDGTVHHMLNDYLRAHHAGAGRWGSVTDMNSCSIGIELDNDGKEPFPNAQVASLLSLLGQLKARYNIPAANFIGHADFAPARKKDPSVLFPWKLLAGKGYGLWYGQPRDSVPAGFNHLLALRIIGYDTRDSIAAFRAFKRHFMQDDSTRRISDADRRVLHCLVEKYW